MISSVLRRTICRSVNHLSMNPIPKQFFFKKIEKDRYDEVISHLQKFFYVDEPLSKSVNLATPEGNPDLEAYIIETLEEKLSIMAVTEDNKLAGVMLNGYFRKGDKEKFDEKVAQCATENFRKIVRILCDVNVPVDLFSKFSVNEVFDARIMSVDSEFRKHKLGWELLRHSHGLATESGFKVAKSEGTGMFSQQVFEKLGYKTINEIVYANYVDKTGRPVFNIEPPHTSVKLMYKVFD